MVAARRCGCGDDVRGEGLGPLLRRRLARRGPMYWSGWDAATNVELVVAAGLEVISAEIETIDEDGKQFQFLWVVGRKPTS